MGAEWFPSSSNAASVADDGGYHAINAIMIRFNATPVPRGALYSVLGKDWQEVHITPADVADYLSTQRFTIFQAPMPSDATLHAIFHGPQSFTSYELWALYHRTPLVELEWVRFVGQTIPEHLIALPADGSGPLQIPATDLSGHACVWIAELLWV